MSVQPGWYPDPASPEGQTPRLRWWDGEGWTQHTSWQPAGAPTLPSAPGPSYAAPGGASPYAKPPPTTPDGQPLASWGARLGAYLLDSLVTGVVAGVLTVPLWIPILRRYADFIREAVLTGQQGSAPPSSFSLFASIWLPMLGVLAINLAVGFVYQGSFLTRSGATPGKKVTGLAVRLRERPGPLSWGTFARRWVAQYGYVIVALIPIVQIVGLYGWIDGLWPLWDDKRQALHDKFAATTVVRARR